jgi:hypothetical protein
MTLTVVFQPQIVCDSASPVFRTSIEDMRINHSGLDLFVYGEFLNCANITASIEQVDRVCAINQILMFFTAILFSGFLPLLNFRQPEKTKPPGTHEFECA